MLHGCAYYPEHRPEALWIQDARWMREAGMNIARLTDFAWCRLEPEEGHFQFAWLDRAVSTLHAAGLEVLITVPTAGPPAWLVNATGDDDCRMVYEDGQAWEFGGRSMTCPSHPRFLRAAVRIAGALGQRYGNHPAVRGWQLDNELGMYGTRCRCGWCIAGFRAWLEREFGNITAVNERLGMVFGGGEFRTFADVPLPRLAQGQHNPGLKLASHRYFQHANAELLHVEADALRAAGAAQPITHNVCHQFSGWQGQDDPRLFAALDVAGWDCYPVQFAAHPRPEQVALLHACARSYKSGRRYWMLEQQSGSPADLAADDLRQVGLWAWQSVAHGAEAILWFRWDTCRFGAEQYWRGILDHAPRKNERYALVAGLGAAWQRHGPLLDRLTRPRRSAILLDVASRDAWHLNPPGPELPYRDLAQRWFGALSRAGCPADVVTAIPLPGSYDVLVAIGLRLVDPGMIAALTAFVAGGGTLIGGVALATLDRDHVAPAEAVPWGLTEVFGCERVEFSPLSPSLHPPKERVGEHAAAWAGLGRSGVVPVLGCGALLGSYAAETWCDHLAPHGCTVWATFATGSPAAGLPAVTSHAFGRGRAVYIASVLDEALVDGVVRSLVPLSEGPLTDDPWVEVIPVCDGDAHLWFVLNHGHAHAHVTLPTRCYDLLNGPGHPHELAPYQVRLLADASQLSPSEGACASSAQ